MIDRMPIRERSGPAFRKVVLLVVASMCAASAAAQYAAPEAKAAAPPSIVRKVGLDTLKGSWVRPDGGYRIEVADVAADGQIAATYFNPNRLPFAKAQAVLEATTLRVAFELRAGGYDGSTYELVYDSASDRLKGVYYQAVVRQKFDVYFVRK